MKKKKKYTRTYSLSITSYFVSVMFAFVFTILIYSWLFPPAPKIHFINLRSDEKNSMAARRIIRHVAVEMEKIKGIPSDGKRAKRINFSRASCKF